MSTSLKRLDTIIGTRQLLYTLLIIFALIPMFYPLRLPISISARTRKVYSYIDGLKPGSYIFIDFDYDPAGRGEIEPQAVAMMKHLFDKKCKFVIASLGTTGPVMFEIMRRTNPDIFAGKEYGKDWVNIGYVAGGESAAAGLARSISGTVAMDAYGNPIGDLPLLKEVDKAEQFALALVYTTGTDTLYYFVRQWFTPYKTPLILGILGVMGPAAEPFVAAGQAVELMVGQVQGAEYEVLVGRPGIGLGAMDAQSTSHAIILVFIILGNIMFWSVRLRGEKR
ncbi:MAG: hypothetical protein QW638_00245 [Candidatus Bathyarchaeia archaeon]